MVRLVYNKISTRGLISNYSRSNYRELDIHIYNPQKLLLSIIFLSNISFGA